MKSLLILVALLYVGSYLAGWYLISIKSPIAVETSKGLQESVLTQQPFTSILQSLRGGELVQAILVTFLVNLTAGAFLTTTLPGILPLVGSLGALARASPRRRAQSRRTLERATERRFRVVAHSRADRRHFG